MTSRFDQMFSDEIERTRTEREVRRAYHTLFNSPLGRKVLAHMLVRLHYFDEVGSPEEVSLNNYAKDLLNTIGILQGFNVDRIVDAMFRAPIEDPAIGGDVAENKQEG